MFNKLAAVAALAVALAAGIGAARASGAGASLKSKCVITGVKRYASDRVTASGRCYDAAGQPVAIKWSISYAQYDYNDFICGSSKITAPGFTPKMSGTYYLVASIKLSASDVKNVRPAKLFRKIKLGHWQRQCGHVEYGIEPTSAQLCDLPMAPFTDGPCQMELPNGYSKSNLPEWGGKPEIFDNAIFAPPLLSRAGSCLVDSTPSSWQWMGLPVSSDYWSCSDGSTVMPWLTIYYWPPGGSVPCVLNEHNLPGDHYSHVQLPKDWRSWGGKMAIVFKGWFFGPNPRLNQPPDGVEYSTLYLMDYLTGSANACSELQNYKY